MKAVRRYACPLAIAALLVAPATAVAAESGRGPAYVEAHLVGAAILFSSIDSGFANVPPVTTTAGRYPVELHGGYHFSGRHDGFVVGGTQKFFLGGGSAGASLLRAGYDFAIPIGRREITIAPHAFGGALYPLSEGDTAAYLGFGVEGRLFPLAKREEKAAGAVVAPKRVLVAADRIEIKEKIQFRTNEAVIESVSFSLLDEIAGVITRNPQLKIIRIEGHASSEGDAVINEKLSDERARAVRNQLVERGVPQSALEAKGYGAKRPIASNDAEEGREKNRRVEFNIVKQDATRAVERVEEADSGAGEGFFVVVKPFELGFVTSTPGVTTLSFQAGVGYAF